MRKENVFLISGRFCNEDTPRGPVMNYVVCASNEKEVRNFVYREIPDFNLSSITNFTILENTIKKVKSILSGEDSSWPLLVHPNLQLVD